MSDRSDPDQSSKAADPAVCVVVSRYNERVTDAMRRAAVETYESRFPDGTVHVAEAPGAFELVALAAAAAKSGRYHGVLALGCVIRGETDHDRYISQAVADGLARIGIETGVPAAFGVLTVNNPAQAEARAGGAKGNKGAEAMDALLEAVAAIRAIRAGDADAEGVLHTLGGAARDKTVSAGGAVAGSAGEPR